jgi:hypothetical protein
MEMTDASAATDDDEWKKIVEILKQMLFLKFLDLIQFGPK